MSFVVTRWRPAPLLPRALAAQALLGFVVAVLCFIAAAASVGAAASLRAERGWTGELAGSASVLVRTSGLESPDAAAARAAETLAGVRGVAEARALSASEANALLSRFIDPKALPAGVWTPRLVAVDFSPGVTPPLSALRDALAAQGINAVVEDHARWTDQVRRSAHLTLALAVGLLLLMIAAVAAISIFAVRQGMLAYAPLIDILRLCGATDGFIGGLFAGRLARVSAIGGVIGALIAALSAATLLRLDKAGGADLPPPAHWPDLALAAPPLFLAVAAAGLAATASVRRRLSRSD